MLVEAGPPSSGARLAHDHVAPTGWSDDLVADPENANSAAVMVWHLSGNLEPRFTDFLTADSEFECRHASRPETMEKWEGGWAILFAALGNLAGEDPDNTDTIRGIPVRVDAALLRSMAHIACHVGQIVHLAKRYRGEAWEYLTVPPGQSAAYNENPILENTGTRKHARTSADGRARCDRYRQQAGGVSRALACRRVSRRQVPQPLETSRAETVA